MDVKLNIWQEDPIVLERGYRFDQSIYEATKAADDWMYVEKRSLPGPRGSNRKATAKRRAANRAARKARKAPK